MAPTVVSTMSKLDIVLSYSSHENESQLGLSGVDHHGKQDPSTEAIDQSPDIKDPYEHKSFIDLGDITWALPSDRLRDKLHDILSFTRRGASTKGALEGKDNTIKNLQRIVQGLVSKNEKQARTIGKLKTAVRWWGGIWWEGREAKTEAGCMVWGLESENAELKMHLAESEYATDCMIRDFENENAALRMHLAATEHNIDRTVWDLRMKNAALQAQLDRKEHENKNLREWQRRTRENHKKRFFRPVQAQRREIQTLEAQLTRARMRIHVLESREAAVSRSASNQAIDVSPIQVLKDLKSRPRSNVVVAEVPETDEVPEVQEPEQSEPGEKTETETETGDNEELCLTTVLYEASRRIEGRGRQFRDTISEPLVLDQLGSGAFGRVHRCWKYTPHDCRSAVICVVKRPFVEKEAILRRTNFEDRVSRATKTLYQWHEEVNFLRVIWERDFPPKADNIVKFLGYAEFSRPTGIPERHLYLEQYDGSLHAVVGERFLDEQEALKLLLDMMHGLAIVHEQRILHNDIKPANILYNLPPRAKDYRQATWKIADFGMATMMNGEGKCGRAGRTYAYASPERWIEGDVHGQEADIWAVFASWLEVQGRLDKEISRTNFDENARAQAVLNAGAKTPDFVDMGAKDPEDRPDAKTVAMRILDDLWYRRMLRRDVREALLPVPEEVEEASEAPLERQCPKLIDVD